MPQPAVDPGARATESPANAPYRVMIVDDSAVIRGLLTRSLESDPAVRVVATVGNGLVAIQTLARTEVDVIVLDIEMPVMDGLTALPKLIAAEPDVKVIVASTLTQKNAQVSLKCLSAGAHDYIAKPTTTTALNAAVDFKRELLEKVKALASVRTQRRVKTGAVTVKRTDLAPVRVRPVESKPIVLRSPGRVQPEVLAIGSSTGGPQALFSFFQGLPAAIKQPILITQHMPPTFTTILAEHLARVSGRESAEAVDGEAIRPKRIYLAPGDFHMTVETKGTDKVIRLNKGAPENFCRPSVDPMLRSLVAAYGARLAVVILTGMGQDGLKGARVVVEAGGSVIAQDEASSVVWGMPGAVATAGLCSAVLPLGELPSHVARLLERGGV